MSDTNWILEKNLCRLCHAQGNFKNLAEPCLDSGQEEIYADMLKYCFDINLVPVAGMLCAVTYTICEMCIKKLQDVSKFKKSVVACEEKFIHLYNSNVIKVGVSKVDITVKEEWLDSCNEDDFSLPDDSTIEDLPDYEYNGEVLENKSDLDEIATKTKKPTLKSKKVKTVSVRTKKVGRPKKLKQEEIVEEEEEEVVEKRKRDRTPKFRLSDTDYTTEGATFACKRCDKRYDKIYSLRFHVKTKHYKIPRFVCPYCKKEFMTAAPLTVHKLQEHNIDERFKCNACKGTFNTKVQLRKHKNNFHMLGERHTCEFCDYESFSFESMYKHKFKHKTSKDYQCKFCRKAFVRKTTLVLHERIHTGDRRKVCNICGQAFVQKASLNYHMTKYHPEVNF